MRSCNRRRPRVHRARAICRRRSRVPGGTAAYLANLYEVPLLTREQEVHLFRKMNYLKYKARRLRDKLDVNRPKSSLMRQIEGLYEESAAIKNQVIRANLRLVVSIAKRYVGPAEDFFELVSDGNMSLMRAVQKFDVSQGNRFSTYASWAIMKNFARTISTVVRHRSRFCTNHAEEFGAVEDMPHGPLRGRVVSKRAGVAGGGDSQPAGRAGAADRHQPLRLDSRPETADLETSRRRTGRIQRACPSDPVESAQQTENGRRGGPHRVIAVDGGNET